MKTMHISRWRKYFAKVIGTEISAFSRYYDQLIQYKILENDSGLLYQEIECAKKTRIFNHNEFPDLTHERQQRSLVFFNGTFNHHHDIQELLSILKPKLSRTSRIVVVVYNSYYRWLYILANKLGIRKGEAPNTFITSADIVNICKISGFDLIKLRSAVFFPFKWFWFGAIINWLFPALPFIKNFGLVCITVLRPIIKESKTPSLSIVIPARNEKGNIRNALERMPKFDGADLEIIFVEGHSVDGTWEEIAKVQKDYSSRFYIKAHKQKGIGKADAVRLGFAKASRHLLTILDADLTMPPERLELFYEAYCLGLADFINGNRLVYPMEKKAMRFLNRLGNAFFAKTLSYILDIKIGDSLCGTKLITRHDYQRFESWRKDFGAFDPFGDFELLYPAAILSLGIIDIPIRYLDRKYGNTNISRFHHGIMLFWMLWTGFFKIKVGRYW
jgi:hypothetical protein